MRRMTSCLSCRKRRITAKEQTIGLVVFVVCVFMFNSILQTRTLWDSVRLPDIGFVGQTRQMTSTTFEPFVDVTEDCFKRVHIFGNLTDMREWPELGSWYHLFQRSRVLGHVADVFCPVHNCTLRFTIGTNWTHFRGKDAVIFGALPKAFETRFKQLVTLAPEVNQTWIYYSTETPLRVVQWNRDLRVADLRYHKIMTYRADSDIPIPFGHYRKRERPLTEENFRNMYGKNKTKLVAWMASNCAQIFWPRMPLVEQLSRLLPLDQYGRCGKMTCLPQRSQACNDMLRQYKFYMTLANSECREYITEKFWEQTIGNGIVPVVYGAPKEDFERLGPPNSFIHLADFSSRKDLAQHLKSVAADQDAYMKYFEWTREYEVVNTYPINVTDLCKIISHLYNGTVQTIHRLGNSTWYRGCRSEPSKDIMTPFWPREQTLAYFTWSIWGSERDGMKLGPQNLHPF